MRLVSSRRPLVVVAALPALLLGLLALPGPQASAAPAPVATSAKVSVTGAAIPAGSAAGYALVQDDTDVTVTVDLSLAGAATAVSSNKDTTFALTLSGGANTFNGAATVVVKAGQSSGFATVQLADPSKLTSVGATVTAGSKEAFALAITASPAFDVLSDLTLSSGAVKYLSLNNNGGGSNAAGACTATPTSQLCADLYLPSNSTAALSFGPCPVGTPSNPVVCGPGTELQALFGLVAGPGAPATMVYRCDKTLCGGGSLANFPLYVSLTFAGALTQAPTCTIKGVQTGPNGFCYDAKQTTRDNAGDSNFYLLLDRDARVTFP